MDILIDKAFPFCEEVPMRNEFFSARYRKYLSKPSLSFLTTSGV